MNLLYVMHVNWHWIRQRPQVLAEALARQHAVTLLDFAMYRGKHHAAEPDPPFPRHTLMRVPERLNRLGGAVGRFNAAWLARQVSRHVERVAPDVLWITHPVLEAAVRPWPDLPVTYDCMDDHAAFAVGNAAATIEAERRLLERADLTLFSSASLARRVTHRSSVRRFEVVNNGLADGLLERLRHPSPAARPPGDGPATLGYFGTVSHWFDWALTARLLDALPQARLLLAGPIETAVPAHPRIRHVGVLAHAALPDFAARCDVLLMPFRLTPLIEAVDPVKLYEYIAANRPALAPRYAESERFAPWVRLYRDADEAIGLLREMLEQPTPPTRLDHRLQFLATNTWAGRTAQIERLLPGLVRERAPACTR